SWATRRKTNPNTAARAAGIADPRRPRLCCTPITSRPWGARAVPGTSRQAPLPGPSQAPAISRGLPDALDHTAGQARARRSRRLGPVIVGMQVDQHGTPDDILRPEFVGEEGHEAEAFRAEVGEDHGEVAGMVAVGLPCRIPMVAGRLERVF